MVDAGRGRIGILGLLDDEVYAAIAPDLQVVHVAAGQEVFHADDAVDGLYVIVRGLAQVSLEIDGQQLILAEIESGDFFGEMSLFEQRQRRSTTVAALKDLELIRVPNASVQIVIDRDPMSAARWYHAFFLRCVGRILHSNDVVAEHFRSRLKQLEHERQEQELTYLLAHDLRSPLAIAEAGLAQLLERPDKTGALTPQQERVLKRSRRSLLFLRQMLEEILEVGRSESGISRPEATSLADILLVAVPQSLFSASGPTLDVEPTSFEAMRSALAPQGLTFDIDANTAHAPLYVDRMRLIQVLMNLVGNALKYAPGSVCIRARRREGLLEVAVMDRGPGIPESFRSSIFERYRQAGAKAEGLRRGFGLGLAGARQLVEAMGGTILAESGEGGMGTTIAFQIPWREPRA